MNRDDVLIGVDVGGTNTDAAALRAADRSVLAGVKSPTTGDVAGGVVAAIDAVLGAADIDPASVRAVMIGTTHFVNALVSAHELDRTAVVRVCGPATRSIPPLTDWPATLRTAVTGAVELIGGGNEFDGRPISAVDDDELAAVAEVIRSNGLTTAAVTSVFSAVDPAAERYVADRLRELVPGLAVSTSAEIGRIGLLERENATVINASLRSLADRVVSGFERSVRTLGIDAPLFLSQNDGTLMDAARASAYPISTFASGPTNSMRGAAYLSGLTDAAVVDIGGTTADIGVLRRGFPRESALAVSVAGVRTNFRMPDVVSLGIGGGSRVRAENGTISVGPDSVGYHLRTAALVFGGATLTATDIAVAAGFAEIGDPALVAGVDRGFATDVVEHMRERIGAALDRMKTGPGPIPAVLVGGGSVIVGGAIPGAAPVVLPDHFAAANAVGAAIAQVGAEVDRVVRLDGSSRAVEVDGVRAAAIARCRDAGADPATIAVVEIEEVPLAYLPSNAVRIKVKAVGDLAGVGA